ncbi:hypothetical protein BaRGS_00026577 [Batillaria attramentaria]|uniref:Uncharacterized protein n=1 Tax=Batillaria attramentaria TaxID=370345 RepID=A0ABD0K5I2_9CAEN
MLAVVFLALVAIAAAQKPTPCPDISVIAWSTLKKSEGRDSGPTRLFDLLNTRAVLHVQMDRERNVYVEGGVAYDAENRRVREFEYEKLGSQVVVYDKLKLYNMNTEYTVNLKTRKCNVTTPRHGFRPYGVPPEARYAGQGTIGAVGVPNEEVTISVYVGEFEGRDPFMVTVTEPDCFPVEFSVYSKTSGFEHREFFDVVSGITDPDAFIPPKECISP